MDDSEAVPTHKDVLPPPKVLSECANSGAGVPMTRQVVDGVEDAAHESPSYGAYQRDKVDDPASDWSAAGSARGTARIVLISFNSFEIRTGVTHAVAVGQSMKMPRISSCEPLVDFGDETAMPRALHTALKKVKVAGPFPLGTRPKESSR